jgi:hypothetical protein
MRLRRGIERAFAALTRAWRAVVAVTGPVVALLVRLLGPRLSIVSPAGWFAIALAAVAFIAGYALGWAELTYVGFAIVAALVVCAFFLFGRSTYAVDVELTPSRVTVGQRALGRLLVRNDGTRRVLPSGWPSSRFRRSPQVQSTMSSSPCPLTVEPSSSPVPHCRCAATCWVSCGARFAGPSQSSCSCTRTPSRSHRRRPAWCATSRVR